MIMINFQKTIVTALCLFVITLGVRGQTPYKVLIIDGQNDHSNWRQTTEIMKGILEETGLFSVDVATNPPSEGGALDSFNPNFAEYQAVISNYNGYQWPEDIRKNFENYVNNGGGLVIIHAANNAFPEWQAYNRMIGVGGGIGRGLKAGVSINFGAGGGLGANVAAIDRSEGQAGAHSPEHQFRVIIRNNKHPITAGLPQVWLHENDALYNQLRGPATNMEVLATAFSDKAVKGSGRHEPVMMVINFGKGRVFHTTLGHGVDAQKGVGFITILQRGTEWAASGKVTQKVPNDFPTASMGRKRP
jgi:type 1 glutamine amidotransferase